MKIEIKEIEGKLQYLLPIKEIERIRLKNFINPPDFVKQLDISLRNYYRLLKNPYTIQVKTANSINKFIKNMEENVRQDQF